MESYTHLQRGKEETTNGKLGMFNRKKSCHKTYETLFKELKNLFINRGQERSKRKINTEINNLYTQN